MTASTITGKLAVNEIGLVFEKDYQPGISLPGCCDQRHQPLKLNRIVSGWIIVPSGAFQFLPVSCNVSTRVENGKLFSTFAKLSY